jgi:alpha-beta hydrolase superfamily lysophospholipase
MDASDPLRGRFFEGSRGLKLWAEGYPADGAPRAAVLLVHGYAEHGGRYADVAQKLAEAGYTAMTFDYRGHGRAQGARGHCDRFVDYLDDLDRARARLAAAVPGRPIVLLAMGHGGLIALRALCEPERWKLPGVEAAILVSPYLGTKLLVPAWKVVAGRVASRLYPRLSIPHGLDPENFSHDPASNAAFTADPLTNRVGSARWHTEMLAAQAYVADRAPHIGLPTLWLVAGDDRVVDSDVTRSVFARVGGDSDKDKQLHVYEGLYHELLNEIGKEQVLANLEAWLASRFPRAEKAA